MTFNDWLSIILLLALTAALAIPFGRVHGQSIQRLKNFSDACYCAGGRNALPIIRCG